MQYDDKKIRLGVMSAAAAVAGLMVTAGLASAQMAQVDADADGMVSFTELLMIMPAMSEEEFTALDADADGVLNAEEIAAAQEAGLLPAE